MSSTIIAAPLDPRILAPLLADPSRLDLLHEGLPAERHFKIESADSYTRRQSVNSLLRQRYGWRGYHSVALPAAQASNHLALTATQEGQTIGTMTVGFDGPEGMNCEKAFAGEIDALRAEDKRLCEFTKLAVDPVTGTKRVLAALFHVAYIVAHRLRRLDALVMEVNPRHVRYYQRMLGARVIGDERLNRSVNAPAVLLSIDFDYVAAQIRQFAGKPERCAAERSLYPFAFTRQEEEGIISRLTSMDRPARKHDAPFVFRLPTTQSPVAVPC